jgi:hypothetical protein
MTWYGDRNAQAYSTSALITAVEKFYGAGSMSNNQLGGKERKKESKRSFTNIPLSKQKRPKKKNENNHFLCKKTILYCHTTF